MKLVLRIRIHWIRNILVPGPGSAKICGSTDLDLRGKISIKNCEKVLKWAKNNKKINVKIFLFLINQKILKKFAKPGFGSIFFKVDSGSKLNGSKVLHESLQHIMSRTVDLRWYDVVNGPILHLQWRIRTNFIKPITNILETNPTIYLTYTLVVHTLTTLQFTKHTP